MKEKNGSSFAGPDANAPKLEPKKGSGVAQPPYASSTSGNPAAASIRLRARAQKMVRDALNRK